MTIKPRILRTLLTKLFRREKLYQVIMLNRNTDNEEAHYIFGKNKLWVETYFFERDEYSHLQVLAIDRVDFILSTWQIVPDKSIEIV